MEIYLDATGINKQNRSFVIRSFHEQMIQFWLDSGECTPLQYLLLREFL